MMEFCLIAFDKEPRLQPIGIGDIIQKLLANCTLLVTGPTKTASCANLNICSGFGAGTEGTVHVTLEKYGKARSQLMDAEEGEVERTLPS